jgi:hypothetical protein
MGVELFHEDGQTDMTKLIVAFHNFTGAPNKWPLVSSNEKRCFKDRHTKALVIGE